MACICIQPPASLNNIQRDQLSSEVTWLVTTHLCVIYSQYNYSCVVKPQRIVMKHYWSSGIMKTKENARQESCLSQSTVQSIVRKWEYGTTAYLPRHGRPSKLTAQARRALIREADKRPMDTLEELQRFTAQMGESVDRTTNISRVLYKSVLYGKGWKESHFCKQAIRGPVCSLHKPCREQQACGRRCSDQRRPK